VVGGGGVGGQEGVGSGGAGGISRLRCVYGLG